MYAMYSSPGFLPGVLLCWTAPELTLQLHFSKRGFGKKSNQVQEDSQEVSPDSTSPPLFSFNLMWQKKVDGIGPFQPAGGRQWRDSPVRRWRLCHGEPPDPLEPQHFHSHVQVQDLCVKRPADVSCYRWLGKNNQLTSAGFIASLQVSRLLCSGWIHHAMKKLVI